MVTTRIEMTPPKGFAIDSFVPAPGWHRVTQTTGSGEDAIVTKVTWTGGAVPTGEDAAFSFLASVQKAGDSLLGKPSQPLAHARRAGLHPCCNLLAVQTIGGQKNDSGTFHQTPFGFRTAHPVQQRLFLLSREVNFRCRSTHST